MIRAAVALSTRADTARAALEAGGGVAERLGRPADWCVAFATWEHAAHLTTLQETLAGVVETPYVVGCSAAGVLAAGREVEQGPAVAVLGVVSDRLRGTPFLFQDAGDQGMTAGIRLGQRLQGSRQSDVILVWADPYSVRPDHLVRSLDAMLGGVPVIGGAASARGTESTTFQFCGNETDHRAVAGLRLGGEFKHHVGVTQGCRPLGAPLRVTGAHDNLILEVEGRPALEVLREQAPDGLLDDTTTAFHYLFVGRLPEPPTEGEAPDGYLVRNIVAVDPRAGVLGISDYVEEGEHIVFAHREPDAAREDLSRMLGTLAPERTGTDYRFGLYFNCLARGSSLYREPGVDSRRIAESFPDVPILGFFCNAEIGPLQGQNRLFTYTGVLSLFGE